MFKLSEYKRRLFQESIWVFIGKFLTALGTLAGLRMLTEVVPPNVYGTVVLIVGLTILGQGLTAQPMMQAVLRFYPVYQSYNAVRKLRENVILNLRYPLLIVLIVLVMSILVWFWGTGNTFVISLLSALLFLLSVLRVSVITFLNAAREQRAMAILMSADAWFRPLMAVVMVWFLGANTKAVLCGFNIGAAMVLFLYFCFSSGYKDTARVAPDSELPDSLSSKRLWIYATPLIPLSLLGWITGQADRYMLGIWTGLDAAGQYAALYGLASRPFLMLSDAVQLALRQPYYEHVSSANRTAEQKLFKWWLVIVILGSLVFLVIFAFFHKEIAKLVLGPEYRKQSALIIWIGGGYVLAATARVIERVCYAYHDTRGVLLIQVTVAALSLAITAPMVYVFGTKGAAWAVPIYFGLQVVVTSFRARQAKGSELVVSDISDLSLKAENPR